jgi:hypothetical protein
MKVVNYRYVLCFILCFQTFLGTTVVKHGFAEENQSFQAAQAIIDRLVAEHPEIVRLTIHAVPTGEKHSRIIACNIKEKIGRLSDPEDLEAMKSNTTTVLKEGDNLDVTVPISGKTGIPIAASGITLAVVFLLNAPFSTPKMPS